MAWQLGFLGLAKRRESLENFLRVQAPQLLGPDAVPQDAGEPQGDADLNGAEHDVVRVTTGQVDSEIKSVQCM